MVRKGWMWSGGLIVAVAIVLWQWPWRDQPATSAPVQHVPLSPPPTPPSLPASGTQPSSPEVAPSLAGLQLIALFQTEDARLASAVIVIDDDRVARYHVGDELGQQRRIKALRPDHALIDTPGGVQVLRLVPLSGQTAASPEALAEEDAPTPRERVLAELDLTPVAPGLAAGYWVGEGFPQEAGARSGVQPGDKLLSLNGFPLGEPGSDELAWQSLEESGTALVHAQREGMDFFVRHPEREAAPETAPPE